MITSLIKAVPFARCARLNSCANRRARTQNALSLLAAGFLTITLATTDAFAQKTPSTPVPSIPGAQKPAPAAADNQPPKTPSTPTPSSVPGQPATGTTVATPTPPTPAATPTPAAIPATPDSSAPATKDEKSSDAPSKAADGVPAGGQAAKPLDYKIAAKQPEVLNTLAEIPIPPNQFADNIFLVFNYGSIVALVLSVVCGTLWYVKHKKRVALGLDDDDDGDEDYDDDDHVPAKVQAVTESQTVESKSVQVPEETKTTPAEDKDTSSATTSTDTEKPAGGDTASDATVEPAFTAIPSSNTLLTDSADPATILSGNPKSTSSSESVDKSDSSSASSADGKKSGGSKKKSRKKKN